MCCEECHIWFMNTSRIASYLKWRHYLHLPSLWYSSHITKLKNDEPNDILRFQKHDFIFPVCKNIYDNNDI